jgi:hypothetical protein
MSQGKIKLYKNSGRAVASESHKPYVPQYQLLGVEPEEYKSATLPAGATISKSNVENPRVKRPMIRQPYAETSQSLIGAGKSVLPNVGNNMEQTWSSVDGDIIDDLGEFNNSNQIIDNNDYVSDNALGLPESRRQPQNFEAAPSHPSKKEGDDLLSVVQDLEEQSYLLIVNGVSLCSGPLSEIEDQARALVFGEHELCDENPVPVEDIIILKRVSVKMGLFLE